MHRGGFSRAASDGPKYGTASPNDVQALPHHGNSGPRGHVPGKISKEGSVIVFGIVYGDYNGSLTKFVKVKDLLVPDLCCSRCPEGAWISFIAISLKHTFSKMPIISPTRRRCNASGCGFM